MISHEEILVCMPTFHADPSWILRAIKSVQNQTYPHFNCFIVKDSCSKTTQTCLECENCIEIEAIVKSVIKKDSRFKYFNLPSNCSGSGWGPRNFAIMNSSNNLIAYLDDDNWSAPDHLECLYKKIQENDSDLAYTGTRLLSTKNQLLLTRIHPFLPKEGYIDTSEMLHKRWLINKYGGWRCVKKGADWDLVSRWIPNIKWAHTKKITLNFFVREGCGTQRQ